MFSRLKYRIFGDPEENLLLKALASGKMVVSGHDIIWEHDYDFGSYMDSRSYITLIRRGASTKEYAKNYAQINPYGKLTVFKDGESATSSKSFKKLFKAAYKIVQDRENAASASAQQKEDERFIILMLDVFGSFT